MSLPSGDGEIALLEQLIAAAKARHAKNADNIAIRQEENTGPKFQIKTFNAISPLGLGRFPKSSFLLTGSSGKVPPGVNEEPHAILLRSHNLLPEEVASTVRAIARCGAGTNNCPIEAMTARGIPVFNTPGANANSVKELVLCGLLLASRGVVEGIIHVKDVIVKEAADHKEINLRAEKDKSRFVGQEIFGKTLAVLGLGNIGALVADAALALGMNVVGYDPVLSVEAAWRLPGAVKKASTLVEAFQSADYVTIHMPYIKGVTHHCINEEVLSVMKPTCHLINFARGEIVDGVALAQLYRKGHKGKYISDFPDESMQSHPNFIHLPHLGACTAEAEDNCAKMAAEQMLDFLETGTIRNAVNFPTASLQRQGGDCSRFCIITRNVPGVLGEITTLVGKMSLNISQQLNTSRGTIAYNVLDVENGPATVKTELPQALMKLDAVISVRIIWTGSAAEGPNSFYTK